MSDNRRYRFDDDRRWVKNRTTGAVSQTSHGFRCVAHKHWWGVRFDFYEKHRAELMLGDSASTPMSRYEIDIWALRGSSSALWSTILWHRWRNRYVFPYATALQ